MTLLLHEQVAQAATQAIMDAGLDLTPRLENKVVVVPIPKCVQVLHPAHPPSPAFSVSFSRPTPCGCMCVWRCISLDGPGTRQVGHTSRLRSPMRCRMTKEGRLSVAKTAKALADQVRAWRMTCHAHPDRLMSHGPVRAVCGAGWRG
eukprot:SAG11_NODE_2425_length_3378_cov_2.513118_2_plen_147_part_00